MKMTVGGRAVSYVLAYLFALIALYPIVLMISSSLKTNMEIFASPLSLPKTFSLDTYKKLWEVVPFADFLWNSVFVSVLSVLLITVFSAMAAFYLSRFSFKWTAGLYFFFIIGLMIPIKLGIVPLFLLMKNLGLLNSLWSLILIYTAGGIPISVFILTGFFRTLPIELEEAARIDGCSHFQVFWRVLLPLIRPALATVVIINFIHAWNDFFFPLIFIQEEALKTIPVGMMVLFGEYETDWSLLFAGLTLSALPMIVVFLMASRQFMEGLTAGAVK
ncbi:carbohydrate ABC transporter permease [Brevibacillus formosus]|uniref:Sugar ABC transporter permease n=1 Tax=Brevibacillus formosus TaxID=54913 RepID=A0A837KM71_9BACL|nr:carbohydrate ABC transporter permease [Brevibacillus formosus]KLH98283.1 sugar ABC transporter permease [Brevibacillus formosus]MED1957099.1 carbohydrate ABC transporter permease [Brevibacillus formosus]PSJ94349.1 carbohydrate ABC transporter permease [Brevibacillus formosus]GED61210.1 sugar ABC transporter permease [Brevibacillus formosus]